MALQPNVQVFESSINTSINRIKSFKYKNPVCKIIYANEKLALTYHQIGEAIGKRHSAILSYKRGVHKLSKTCEKYLDDLIFHHLNYLERTIKYRKDLTIANVETIKSIIKEGRLLLNPNYTEENKFYKPNENNRQQSVLTTFVRG